MSKKRPTTIAEYIDSAVPQGKHHLSELYAILKSVAPQAEEAIKWGQPFFVEPRFLFAFSAYKMHAGFTASIDALEPVRDKLQGYEVTKMGILKIPYSKPVPKALVMKIARTRLKIVGERKDTNFWQAFPQGKRPGLFWWRMKRSWESSNVLFPRSRAER